MLALVADERGDAALRDATLASLCAGQRAKAPRTVAVLDLVRAALAPGGPGRLDLAAVDRELEATEPAGRGNIAYYVGLFLLKHGGAEEARPYLGRAAESPDTFAWFRARAKDLLLAPAGRPGARDPGPAR